ncbi:hypothetical protein FRC09_016013 [Ceratobasidium sp. 395]|nr:hypothetical protein FRC09_016013 [Ceratobasidium sp. 395]
MYGLGVDNVLQLTVVKANGKTVVANACKNEELFWALRGGGGGTYGVALHVTYRTHPPLDSIVGMVLSINVTNTQQLTELTEVFFRALPNITNAGVRGYAVWSSPTTFTFIAVHPNRSDIGATNATLQPVFDWISSNPGTSALAKGAVHATFYSFFTSWLQDLGEAAPIWIGGRLVSRAAFAEHSAKLANLVVNTPPYMAGILSIIM